MKAVKRTITILMATVLTLSLSATALAATNTKQIKVDQSKDGIIQISGYNTEKQFNGLPVFSSSSPVTVTFNGSDLYYEEVSLLVDGSCDAAGNISTGEAKADIQFDVQNVLSDTPDDEPGMFLGYPTGNYATIRYSGVYYVAACPEAAQDTGCYIVMTGAADPNRAIAKSSASMANVDGKPAYNGFGYFEGYNINDNNYIKLRALAVMLEGTKKEFEVTWDSATSSINLTSGKAYTEVGGEVPVAFGGGHDLVVSKSAVTVYADGKKIDLTAYNIFGNNFVKIRDVAAAVNFGVSWNSDTSTIEINTSTGYSA